MGADPDRWESPVSGVRHLAGEVPKLHHLEEHILRRPPPVGESTFGGTEEAGVNCAGHELTCVLRMWLVSPFPRRRIGIQRGSLPAVNQNLWMGPRHGRIHLPSR